MVINEVVVFPTKDTLEYLSSVFKNCPFPVYEEQWYVTLNETSGPCAIDPKRTYSASFGSLGYWYDDSVQGSSLILSLDSPDIVTRMAELRVENGTLFHPQPLAFMPLVRYMPPLNYRYRGFVNSVSNILHSNDVPLIFTGEVQAMREVDYVPYELYYRDHE